MIPKECKRLAEVDFPIAVVSKHSAREKSIRHGHPSTLHLWWARRPLAACRAMLMALLLPDPCDAKCPEEFRTKARELLLKMPGWNTPRMNQQVKSEEGLRKAILTFIGDFANWDNSANPDFLSTARALVKAAHPPACRAGGAGREETPLVVDPFAGGGSIPLEALRIGCEAFASDLNPVACLILKVMLEDIPREAHRRDAEGAESLADELRRVGKEIKEKAEKELKEFYPDDPDGAKPIAYLWARTVRCEAPNCGAEIPLMRSFWLCKKPKRKIALRPVIHRRGAEGAEKEDNKKSLRSPRLGGEPYVEFEIFEPKSDKEVPSGTVTRAKATCLCCGTVLPPDRVRAQLAAQRGGADVIFEEAHRGDAERAEKNIVNKENSASSASLRCKRIGGARMLAVVTLKPAEKGRHYRLPTERDYEAVWKAQKRLQQILEEWERLPAEDSAQAGGGRKGLCPVPNEPTPAGGGSGAGRAFSVQKYGMMTFGDLFTARQKTLLACILRLVQESKNESVMELLALVVGKLADKATSMCRWKASAEYMAGNTFSRPALPIVWDWCEAEPFAGASGGWEEELTWIVKVVDMLSSVRLNNGQVQQSDACEHPLPGDSASVFFTDPPYYDAIPYSNLSDFFLAWGKRCLPGHPMLRDPFDSSNPLSPKAREAVQDETKQFNGQPKDRGFFESRMANAFSEGCRVLREDGVGSVVFAHKTTEGWEALLSGMTKGGWVITGSWPIATESGSRLRAMDSAALATSVHLVCRPRPENAPVGDWADVLRELPKRVGDWMERLQGEGIRGADLVFACIGPALEIYSRYSKVVDPDEREIPLGGDPTETDPTKRGYLSYVWEEIGRAALRQVLGTDTPTEIEEDARLTALFLWTARALNGNSSKNGRHKNVKKKDENTLDDEEQRGIQMACEGTYKLPYDLVRRFCQPLGIHLQKWEGRLIETKKGIVRLLSVTERGKKFLGEEVRKELDLLNTLDSKKKSIQLSLFEFSKNNRREERERKRATLAQKRVEAETWSHLHRDTITVLDHVHKAMVLQKQGMTTALRELLFYEKTYRPDFLRLANALSALYPKGSEEKRLLDAMLLAVPR